MLVGCTKTGSRLDSATLETNYYPKGTYTPLLIKLVPPNNEEYYSKIAKAIILSVREDTKG